MSRVSSRLLAAFVAVSLVGMADEKKLSFDQRVEIVRGLMAEYATVKAFLPRSKKPLPFEAAGTWDKRKWEDAGKEFGPAARVGDLVQITHVAIEDDKIVFEINGGMKGKSKWYQHIEVGMGGATTPIATNQSNAPGGTTIALLFHKPIPPTTAAELKKLLSPILDFEKRSATELYTETLPEPVRKAIKEKRAMEGMDRDQVLLALGRPDNKIRETKNGVDTEDWIYGQPPGKVTFVTFADSKVIKVREDYASLGGTVAPPIKDPY